MQGPLHRPFSRYDHHNQETQAGFLRIGDPGTDAAFSAVCVGPDGIALGGTAALKQLRRTVSLPTIAAGQVEFIACHPERRRRSVATEEESKDPENVSSAMPIQVVLTKQTGLPSLLTRLS